MTVRRRITGRDLAVHATLGLLSQCGYVLGIVWSVDLGVPTGTVALIAALQPVVVAVLGRECVSRTQWAGLGAGLLGVALVVAGDLGNGGTAPVLAYALPVLAMLSLVAATFAERRLGSELPLADSLLVQCGASAIVFSAAAYLLDAAAPPASGSFWFAVGWVVLLSTFGGYGFYWLNVRRGSPTRVSTLMYLTPPTTMVLGWLIFGEPLTVAGSAGLVVCVAAVLLVLRPPVRPVAAAVTATDRTPCPG